MKITGVRTRLYEFRAARKLADANYPPGSDLWPASPSSWTPTRASPA